MASAPPGDASLGRRRPAAPLRTLTTDLWYTIVYVRAGGRRGLRAGRRRLWSIPLRSAGFSRDRALAEVDRLSVWARATEHRGRTPTIEEQAAWLSRRAGVPVPAGPIGAGLDRLLVQSGIRVAPGAPKALARLREAGVPVGVVSNVLQQTSEGSRRVLETHGLSELFGSVALSSELPWAKPRPEIFRQCLRELGARPATSAHIGDLAVDVLGAERTGMRPLLYTGLHRLEPAVDRPQLRAIPARVQRVRSWKELPPLFGLDGAP